MSLPSRISLATLAALILLDSAAVLQAQPKPGYMPSSTHIFPAGARRGFVVNVRIGTECFPPGSRFEINSKGVTAPSLLGKELAFDGEPSPRREPTQIPNTYPREWPSQIKIAADAPIGTAYWRVTSAQGGTASRPFFIGDWPEFIETQTNSTVSHADRVTLPVTVNGRINGERDLDHFRFAADAGDVVVCNLMAGRLGSKLDPVAEIVDANGRSLPIQEIRVGVDPVLAFKAESTGEYVLRIGNVTHHGSPAFVYRVEISTSPFVQFAFPAGGQAGSRRRIRFHMLSGTETPRIVERNVEFPKSSASTWRMRDEKLASNAIALNLDADPNVVETEPNNTTEKAMPVELPMTIDGHSLSPDDEDWFRFDVLKGEHYSIFCAPAPQGSSSLPTLMLRDESGKRLRSATGIDAPDGVARIAWTAPKSEPVFLRVRDLQFGARGSEDAVYRLTVRTTRPNFLLTLGTDGLNAEQDGKTPIKVGVTLQGGFSKPIELTFEGLPKGVTAENTTIPAGKTSASVNLVVAKDATLASVPLRLIGRATINGKDVTRIASGRHLGSDHEGAGIGPLTRERLHLTVRQKPLFRLFCPEAYLYAYRGSVFSYPMGIERLDGFDGEITLQIGDRQNRDLDGIQMFPVTISPGETEIKLPIYLPETMHINVQSQSQLYSQAFATYRDRNGQEQSVLVLSEKRNMLRTLPPVVKLKTISETVSAKSGGKVSCRLLLQRTSNFPGPMNLRLLERPANAGFRIDAVEIAAGNRNCEIVARIPADAKPGTTHRLELEARGRMPNGTLVITGTTVMVRVE